MWRRGPVKMAVVQRRALTRQRRAERHEQLVIFAQKQHPSYTDRHLWRSGTTAAALGGRRPRKHSHSSDNRQSDGLHRTGIGEHYI